MFVRVILTTAMALVTLFSVTGSAAAQTSQYRESNLDFLALRSYDAALAAMSKWLAQELDAGGDPTSMPRDVERTWSALVREAARKGIVAGKGNGDGDEALRTQLISDALKGTSAEAWNGTYKGRTASAPASTARVDVRGWDPTEKEAVERTPTAGGDAEWDPTERTDFDPTQADSADWDPTERRGFDPTQAQSPDWDPSSAEPAGTTGAFVVGNDAPVTSTVSSQQLQTISNVSKMLHDTAMAVIRKIG